MYLKNVIIRSLDIEKMLVEDQKAALTMAGFDWDANELPQDTEVRHLHYNRPQLRSIPRCMVWT